MKEIEILDSIHCRAKNAETIRELKTVLCFEKPYRNPAKRWEVRTRKQFLITNKGLFPTGLLERCLAHFQTKREEVKVTGRGRVEGRAHKVQSLPNVEYRTIQPYAIAAALDKKRGVIVAPARSGKTVIGAGIIASINSSHKSLFIVNTLDILSQTVEEFQRAGLDPGIIGEGKAEWDKKVIVCMYQSLRTFASPEYLCDVEVLIIDEAHHARKIDGSYWKILMNCPAIYKVGLTATPPTDEEGRLIMESLIGPIIYKVSQEKAQEIGATVKAKIKIVKVPVINHNLGRKSYVDAYEEGVVTNRSLNRMVVKEANSFLNEGNSVLILVSRVAHGLEIERIFNLLLPDKKIAFLCAGIDAETKQNKERLLRELQTPGSGKKVLIEKRLKEIEEQESVVKEKSKNRSLYRHQFINKEISCIVATPIWNEGVNIPTLNVVINAGGGKSDIRTVQSASRSLTACKGKEFGIIVDFFNPIHRSLIEHFGHRIGTYCDLGWL